MKKLLTLCFAIVLNCSSYAQFITATGSMYTGRFDMTTQMLDNGNILACGGNSGPFINAVTYNSAEVYNAAAGTWSTTGSMHFARTGHASVLLNNGKVLVMGGDYDANNPFEGSQSAELYDPATGTWALADSLLEALSFPVAVKLNNGSVLVVGGGGSQSETYDPVVDKWSLSGMTNLNWGPWSSMTKLANGNAIIVGGENNQAEIYDTLSGKWTVSTHNLTCDRNICKSILMTNGKVLIAGGGPYIDSSTAEVYDPATGISTGAINGFPNPIADCNLFNLSNGKVLTSGLGGIDGNDLQCLQMYDPATNNILEAGPTPGNIFMGSEGYGIYRLNNGKILIAGGYYGFSSVPLCYLIDESLIGTSGVQNLTGTGEASVFPNPGNGQFTLKLPAGEQGVSAIKLFNTEGKEIFITTHVGSVIETNMLANFPQLSNGVYLLQTTTGQHIYYSKVVVNK